MTAQVAWLHSQEAAAISRETKETRAKRPAPFVRQMSTFEAAQRNAAERLTVPRPRFSRGARWQTFATERARRLARFESYSTDVEESKSASFPNPRLLQHADRCEFESPLSQFTLRCVRCARPRIVSRCGSPPRR